MTAGTPPDCRPGCSIGALPNLEAIEADLKQKMKTRAVAKKYSISHSSLYRHVRYCGRTGGAYDSVNIDKPPKGSLLTRRVEDQFINVIKAGGYSWVAAETAGISARTFERWMQRGQEDDEAGRLRSPFRRFFLRVRIARAEARAWAESRVARDRPLEWLRYGPGRERDGRAGWTDDATVIHAPAAPAYVIVFEGGSPKTIPDARALPPVTDTTAIEEGDSAITPEVDGGDDGKE